VAPDELLPTAGADEALDLIARASLREGSVAVVATPTYAMYGIVSEQRGASIVAVPRLSADHAFGLDIEAFAEAAREAQLVWPVRAEQPDRRLRTARANRASAGCDRVGRDTRRARCPHRRHGRGLRRIRRPDGSGSPLRLPETGRRSHAEQGPRASGCQSGLRGCPAGDARADPWLSGPGFGRHRLGCAWGGFAATAGAGCGQRGPHCGAASLPDEGSQRPGLAAIRLANELHPRPIQLGGGQQTGRPRRSSGRVSSRARSAPTIPSPIASASPFGRQRRTID